MAARGSKLRKGSGASSSSKPQRDLVFFIDKCLGRYDVANALRAEGERVEILTDHFPQDAEDSLWLPAVGQNGWIVLSKDKRLRHNYIELTKLLESGTHSFLLTSGNFTGAEMAQAFVEALPAMKALVAKFQPPCVSTVAKSGAVKLFCTHENLIKRITDRR
jgi:predicted nuclease of predicted toxin-antitoxin system